MNVVALALLSVSLQPQAPPPATQTPQDCIEAARDFSARRFKELGPPTSDSRIRLIMIGYDDANEEKLASFLAGLIAEK